MCFSILSDDEFKDLMFPNPVWEECQNKRNETQMALVIVVHHAFHADENQDSGILIQIKWKILIHAVCIKGLNKRWCDVMQENEKRTIKAWINSGGLKWIAWSWSISHIEFHHHCPIHCVDSTIESSKRNKITDKKWKKGLFDIKSWAGRCEKILVYVVSSSPSSLLDSSPLHMHHHHPTQRNLA